MPLKLRLYSDKEQDSDTVHYHIGMHYTNERFKVYFLSPERFTKPEADARIIRMSAELDADTDGIIIANNGE